MIVFARLGLLFLLCHAGLFAGTVANAASYPDRPVQIVVGFAAGGGADRVARLLASGLSQKWGQPVIVVNKPGVGGVIGTEYVARATPDGHTLLLTGNAHTVTPHEMKVPYDAINDFTPITRLGVQPSLLLVNPAVPAKTLKELVALVKAKPGQLNFSSTGGGSPTNLQMMLLMNQLGLNLTNVVYKSGADAVLALVRGEVQVTFLAAPGSRAPIQAGTVRPLAITSDSRLAMYPDVRTVAEALGVASYDGTNVWHGILAPKGTAARVVNSVHDAAIEVIKSPDFQKVLAPDGFVAIGSSPKEFSDFLRADFRKWPALLKRADAK